MPGPELANPAALTPEHSLRADARRNRARILCAAREAFAELGPEAQMDDVARRAEVGVGTVYRHFPTKEALVLELMREKFARMADTAEQALEDDGDPFEALARTLRENAEFCSRDVTLQHSLAGPSVQVWEYAQAEIERLNAAAAELVKRGHRRGTISAEVQAEDLPMLMCGVAGSMPQAPRFDWRRHLELVISLLRPRP